MESDLAKMNSNRLWNKLFDWRSGDWIDMNKDDNIADNYLKFILAADKVAVERGKAYEFTCPICGGKAVGARAEINGHIHASCESCGIRIMQ